MTAAGIVIVTHNSEAEIAPCLEAALATGADVVVVDNASEDKTLDVIRRYPTGLIANQENRGFAAAVNQGIRAVRGDLVLLLNPDAILIAGIEPLSAACSLPDAGGAGGKLVDEKLDVQIGFNIRRFPTPWALAFEVLLLNRIWPRNPVNWHYRCYDFNYDQAGKAEQPAGAFLMIRRDVWLRLGGLDEGFAPVWFEDVDYCKRAWDHGYCMYYIPEAIAVHRGGHSIRKILLEKRQFYWYRSLLKYSFKHFHPLWTRVVCLAVICGCLLRMVGGIVLQRSLRPIKVFGRVVRLAGRYLVFGAAG